MSHFPMLESHQWPEEVRATLEPVKADFGFVPNLEKVLAAAPAALEGYVSLWNLIERTGFSPLEQQVICQEINRQHGCHYCLAHHDMLLKQAGGAQDLRAAVIRGELVSDARLQSLRSMVTDLLQARGHVEGARIEEFLAAGYEPARVLDLIMILACKVISNYTNHLAHTPLESFMQPVVGDK